jgi:hypothetical protein
VHQGSSDGNGSSWRWFCHTAMMLSAVTESFVKAETGSTTEPQQYAGTMGRSYFKIGLLEVFSAKKNEFVRSPLDRLGLVRTHFQNSFQVWSDLNTIKLICRLNLIAVSAPFRATHFHFAFT